MHATKALRSSWLRGALSIDKNRAAQPALFLCPAVARSFTSRAWQSFQPRQSQRLLHLEHGSSTPPAQTDLPQLPQRALPMQCSGCGALSQTSHEGQAGYFNPDRKAVRSYLGLLKPDKRTREEDRVLQDALRNADQASLEQAGVNIDDLLAPPESAESHVLDDVEPAVPLCDRCHNLIHHHVGNPIYHPSIESLHETIDESPYKYNHVYHVVDAADFPMSLLPSIHTLLDLTPLRSHNRRSRRGKFYAGKKTELSFIITRSDLLAPRKEQVDSLMPYLIETLRDALGRRARNVRLGNVRCVSAKRSWWTKELKEDIWKRGGGGWMVGKVNVGKSQLFEAVFPKGRMDWKPPKHEISVEVFPREGSEPVAEPTEEGRIAEQDESLDTFSLLPPAPTETNYPTMPVVSSLPGTTASPIRVPFGNGRGELIDLPGLARSNLDMHVKEEHRSSLIMKSRIIPEQQVIKPGQSLLLGGFIRLTPRTPDLIFLSYAFTPIKPHLTSTEKAISIQNQTGEVNVENIAVPGTGEKTRRAGSFELRWDVTKQRAGPITRKDAVNIKTERLPYRVLAADILIEGCGWVEVVAQVRTKDLFAPRKPATTYDGEILQTLDLSEPGSNETSSQGTSEPNWPVIDVFSPEGRFIKSRRPMNAWLLNKPRITAKAMKSRPRKSMKREKKNGKLDRRRESTIAVEAEA